MDENSKIVQQLLRDKVIDVGIYEKTSGFFDLPKFDYRQDGLVPVYSRRHFELAAGPVGVDEILDLPIVCCRSWRGRRKSRRCAMWCVRWSGRARSRNRSSTGSRGCRNRPDA